MIGRLDHVALGVADLDEAAARWTQQFGLAERARTAARVDLACDDEDVALALEPVAGAAELGHRYVAWRLAKDITLDDAAARLAAHGAPCEREGDALVTQDVEGNAIRLLPYRAPADRRVAHARPAGPAGLRPGHPRKLGHVNFLTGRIHEQVDFYTNVLGLVLTDWLGEDGVWLRPAGGSEHHALAFVNKGYGHLHHVALDLVDIGQMRDALDHLGRCGRWLGW
ncbi:MAG TPA: VOC family protein, partial [Baekduia sp.]